MQKQEYDLVDIIQLLLYHWKIIAIGIFVCATIAYSYASKPSNQYEATFLMAIGASEGISVSPELDSEDVKLGREVNTELEQPSMMYSFDESTKVTTYCGTIIKSQAVLQAAIDNLGMKCTYEDIAETISTSTVDNAPVLAVKITRPDPEESLYLAETIAKVAPKIIKEISKINEVTVISISKQSIEVTKPIKSYVLLGTVSGFILSVIGILGIFLMDEYVRKERDITDMLGIKVLGVIPAAKEDTENVR